MSSARVARLTEGMSLADIQREMNKLGEFRSPPSQYHTMENGQEVIYVKKSGPQDRLKRLVISADMKVDEARPLANLILDAYKKIGVNVWDGGYQNIREALINNKGDFHTELQNLVVLEAMSQHVKNHGF
jgi:hypothetical protein